ncbi:hypothetical protein ACQ4PT_003528 [Festuca glaucescens]
MEGKSSEHKLLFEMLKSNISDDLGRKLKEHQEGLVASVGKELNERIQSLLHKLESVREDLGVDISQIRLEREREGRPDLSTKISTPPTPRSSTSSSGVVYIETSPAEKDVQEKPTGVYVPPPIRGTCDANPRRKKIVV